MLEESEASAWLNFVEFVVYTPDLFTLDHQIIWIHLCRGGVQFIANTVIDNQDSTAPSVTPCPSDSSVTLQLVGP